MAHSRPRAAPGRGPSTSVRRRSLQNNQTLNPRSHDSLAAFPQAVLETETAIKIGLLIRAARYEVDATPRSNGADLAAERHGAIWATFHVDVDREKPRFLRVGATVWGGARVSAGRHVPWDEPADDRVVAFVRERLAVACKKGREANPDHCKDCPDAGHRTQ